ncbi:hypothetical protein JKP88DRAFT_251643 [Tribonema minus]|uniref:Uncharacterized protein n=1 Tax=Tribonema minus TaxID=303371 RepID=A0A835ZII0_9STRA|nr:hypothetical protein JKP88DRAFT_251643 [Tribonema minus]
MRAPGIIYSLLSIVPSYSELSRECDFAKINAACLLESSCVACVQEYVPITNVPEYCYQFIEEVYHQYPIPVQQCDVYGSDTFAKFVRCQAKLATGDNDHCLRPEPTEHVTPLPTAPPPTGTPSASTPDPTIVRPSDAPIHTPVVFPTTTPAAPSLQPTAPHGAESTIIPTAVPTADASTPMPTGAPDANGATARGIAKLALACVAVISTALS